MSIAYSALAGHFIALLLVVAALAGCRAQAPGLGPATWLDRPLDGTALELGPVTIQAHASAAEGVAGFEFFVDDDHLATVAAGGGRLGEATARWTPVTAGTYTIRARAFDGQGNGGSDATSVVVVGGPAATPSQPSPTPSEPTPGSQPTPATPQATATTPPPASTATPAVCPGPPVIAFFTAEPTTITAGESSTLSWGAATNATSAAVEPSIGEVPTPGSAVVSPEATTIYTLAATGCGGTATRQVTIVVNAPTAPPPTPTPGMLEVDLAVTDLFPDNLPQGSVYVRITNNGPGTLVERRAWLSCSAVRTDSIEGTQDPIDVEPRWVTLNVSPGQTEVLDTTLLIDTIGYWYSVTCSIDPEDFLDPVPGNDSYTEDIP